MPCSCPVAWAVETGWLTIIVFQLKAFSSSWQLCYFHFYYVCSVYEYWRGSRCCGASAFISVRRSRSSCRSFAECRSSLWNRHISAKNIKFYHIQKMLRKKRRRTFLSQINIFKQNNLDILLVSPGLVCDHRQFCLQLTTVKKDNRANWAANHSPAKCLKASSAGELMEGQKVDSGRIFELQLCSNAISAP